MRKISLILSEEYGNAYGNAYDLRIKKKWSKPKIYNAGGDLSKRWYVYFSFRNPATLKLERQTPIYAGVNQFDTKYERTKAINVLRDAVEGILKSGKYNPFEDDIDVSSETPTTIPQAFKLVLGLKSTINSYSDFKSRLGQFEAWLVANGFKNRYITSVNKKTVINYLNSVEKKSSARNRNNTRIAISTFFTVLVDNMIVPENFVKEINVLESRPERNKTFSTKQEKDILEHLQKTNKDLLFFINFISYNFLRPIEVCRLKVKDLNTEDKLLYVRAKNKLVKTKLIPDIMLQELPDWSKYPADAFIFNRYGIGNEWNTTEKARREYYTDLFKEVKENFGLGKDFGLYSFRHTAITKLYRAFRAEFSPFETKSKLMEITGHASMSGLESYLRDIDAELPEDYSEMLK